MADENPEGEPKKKGKPIVLILVAVNVLLGGAAAGFFFLRGNSGGGHADAADDTHSSSSSAGPPRQARSRGPIVQFMPVIVNLNEPEGARFLKIALAVQLANDGLTEAVEEAKPVIRDHFIRELSDLNYRQTSGNKNKLNIKRRLIKRFNEAVGTDAAIDMHITEFIVQ
ncbi:MAG: flagellar basal body-associated FliL family protein [Nannocystaceae bacterium]